MTDERRAAIIRLLETRDDHLPTPTRRDHSTSGFAHKAEARISCTDCLANDRTMFGCETCGGTGYIIENRLIDPYATDQKTTPYGFDGSHIEGLRWRDREINLMDAQLAPPKTENDLIADANQHPYAWELARRRMYAQYDYTALDRTLEQLRDADPDAYQALHALYVYRWAAPSVNYTKASTRGLDHLDNHLPEPLRAPSPPEHDNPRIVAKLERSAGPTARQLRDNEIRQLAHNGVDPIEIAKRCHVSIRTVYNVVRDAA